MPVWSFWIMFASFVVLIAIRMVDKKQFSAQLNALSTKQRQAERSLNELTEESEKILREFSRRIAANPPPIAITREAPREMKRTSGSPSKIKGLEKRHQVLSLAQKGRPAREIAEMLKVPSGEVELIMNLNQSNPSQVSA